MSSRSLMGSHTGQADCGESCVSCEALHASASRSAVCFKARLDAQEQQWQGFPRASRTLRAGDTDLFGDAGANWGLAGKPQRHL